MPPRKRFVQETAEQPGRRRSQRASLSAQKSQYFGEEEDEEEEEEERQPKRQRGQRAVSESDESEYEGGISDEEDETGDNDDDDKKDDDDDDDAPRVTFTPHKKLRDLGDTPYAEDRLHPVTMAFLKDLKANNRRNWLKENDAEFRRAQKDWQAFVLALADCVATDVDETIPAELPPQDVIFRVYRDTRFSKDPRPYKPHFSAAFSRTGKKGPYAVYYVHCEPDGTDGTSPSGEVAEATKLEATGKKATKKTAKKGDKNAKNANVPPIPPGIGDGGCYVAAGLWHPPPEDLRAVRASIDERPWRWRRVLGDPFVRKTFFPELPPDADDDAVLAAFARMNARDALKKGPMGFASDHRDIGLLKLRNFTLVKPVPDAMLTSERGREELLALLKAMQPFVAHLNRIVRPDGDEEDESEGGEEEDEE